MREDFLTSTKYVFTHEEVEKDIENIYEGGIKEKYNKLCEKYLTEVTENEQIILTIQRSYGIPLIIHSERKIYGRKS